MIQQRIVFLLLIILCISVNTSMGQYDKKNLQALRITTPPDIDGELNDACWQSAEVATGFIMDRPLPGIQLSQNTEVKLIYDHEAIYVGFVCYDESPDSILAQLSGRDVSGNSDYCGITFSCYQDGINGFTFNVSPTGEQYDLRQNGEMEDLSWNAVWYCKTQITNKGWIAEFKIPFAALRFPDKPEQIWNINFVREIRRTRQHAFWNGVNPLVPGYLTQMGTLSGISNIEPPRRIFFFPYTSAYYVGSSRVDLQACKLEYSIVSPK